MELIITKSDWGMDDIPTTPARMEAIKNAGFDGFEAFFLTCDEAEFKDKSQELDLPHVAGFVAPSPEAFRKGLARVLKRDPILVNCHGGRDYHTHEESVAYFNISCGGWTR